MNIDYIMKIQNAYGTKNRREKQLVQINTKMQKHFEDTYDTDDVLINGIPHKLMIIKDTDGNTFKKKIKSCHDDKFNLGDYVLWNNQYWLITLLDPDDKTWNRGYMYLCTLPLRWQNRNGNIIERWCYSEDFTKYSNGTTGNSTITIGDNQYGLTIPIDDETKQLNRDMRFAIDFEDALEPDVYALTNRKTQLNNNRYFKRGGTMILTMSFNAFHPEKDKLITLDDGSKVWICDYHSSTPSESPDEMTDLSVSISGGSTLRCGRSKSWTVRFTDKDGNEIDTDFKWNIISDIDISTAQDDKTKIQLLVNDKNCIGRSFLLQILSFIDNKVLAEKEICIIDGF